VEYTFLNSTAQLLLWMLVKNMQQAAVDYAYGLALLLNYDV
jgi:hypothetical protein